MRCEDPRPNQGSLVAQPGIIQKQVEPLIPGVQQVRVQARPHCAPLQAGHIDLVGAVGQHNCGQRLP